MPHTRTAVGRTLAALRAVRRRGPAAHPLGAIAAQAALPLPAGRRPAPSGPHEAARRTPHGPLESARAPHLFSAFPRGPQAPACLGAAAVRAALIGLQARTGHIALAYVPLLEGVPLRVHAEQALGPHQDSLLAAPRAALEALWRAPLATDASGWVIQAALAGPAPADAHLARLHAQGYAISATPVRGHDVVAAPVWRGAAVAGAVSLLVRHAELGGRPTRHRLAAEVMDTAAAVGRRLACAGAHRPPG
ncbi:phage tail protein [Streptomyces sp. NPDC002564]|uniref:phage tail protein n=1 Tax=Streptomyces sp. NPDC002564 TaxID=3364649 RepID=UPI00367B5BCC